MNILLLVIGIASFFILIIFFLLKKNNIITKKNINIVYVVICIIYIFLIAMFLRTLMLDNIQWDKDTIGLIIDITGLLLDIGLAIKENKKETTVDFNKLILQKTINDGKCNLHIKLIDEALKISDSFSFYIDDLVICFLLLPNTFCLKFNDIWRDSDEQLFCRKIKLNDQYTELQTGNHHHFIEIERELDENIPDELFDNNAMKFDDRKIVFLKLNGYFFTGKNNNFNEIKLKIRKQLKIKQFSRNIKFELESQDGGFNSYKYSD